MSEETATVITSETERVELAWSREADRPDIESPAPGSDRKPLPWALVALLAAVAAGWIGLGAFVVGQHEMAAARVIRPLEQHNSSPGRDLREPLVPPFPKPPAKQPPVPQPAAAPAPKAAPAPAPQPPAAPIRLPPINQVQVPPPAAPPDALDRFANSLAQQGMHFNQSPATEASEAESMCRELANGGSVQSWITATERKSTNMPPGGAREAVYAAIDAYCPQYDNR